MAPGRGLAIMPPMPIHSSSPVRRYVLLRQRERGAAASRWSLERIAATPREAAAPATARVPRGTGPRR